MRNGILVLVSLLMLLGNAFAQDAAEQVKFELIRETINFLATDKKVSQDTAFRISCETMDYDCFDRQLAGQPVAGIERWYNRWRSVTTTDTAGLLALRDKVFGDIFERQGKAYRKQLPSYPSYVSRIEQLIDQYGEPTLREEPLVDTSLAPVDSLAGMYPAVEEAPENNVKTKEDPMIAYLALILGIIALILAALPLFKKKEEQAPADFQGLAERMDELSFKMNRLDRKLTDPQAKDAVKMLTEIMESVEKRVAELESHRERDAG